MPHGLFFNLIHWSLTLPYGFAIANCGHWYRLHRLYSLYVTHIHSVIIVVWFMLNLLPDMQYGRFDVLFECAYICSLDARQMSRGLLWEYRPRIFCYCIQNGELESNSSEFHWNPSTFVLYTRRSLSSSLLSFDRLLVVGSTVYMIPCMVSTCVKSASDVFFLGIIFSISSHWGLCDLLQFE